MTKRSALLAVLLASVAIVAGTLGAAALFANSATSFAATRNYPTGRIPVSVAIGDLNDDGKPDLVTASYLEDGAVSVLLNRGDGSFRAKLDYRTGNGPFSVAIGDLNGDGKPDLVTGNTYNPDADTVSVLLNRGGGSFQAEVSYGTGESPSSVVIGDLNGDGKPDLATANELAHTVSVLLNRGDGSFQAKLDYPAYGGPGLGPYSLAIGDLNGDRRPDLATTNPGPEENPGKTISVLLNRGDGSFQAARNYRTGRNPSSVAIGDLNGDRRRDLAIANSFASSVSVFLNRGDGTFRAKRDYATGHSPYSVAIGDLNGDRKPDLATTHPGAHTVSVLLNRGDGSFRAKLDYGTGGGPYSVAIGDLNGDGKPDLVTANVGEGNNRGKTVSVLLNTPGLCTVQDVKGDTLSVAKRTIVRANCRVGKIRRVYSARFKRVRVISQKPTFGAVLRGGGKVNLVVSRGRRAS
jgi:VCBS repeat protein/PASTA domain-containing protein